MGESASVAEIAKEKPGKVRERRKQERFACNGFAEVVLDDVAFLFRGTVLDLSLTGCYIQSRARLKLAPGTAVELKFSVKSAELLLPARIAIIRPGAGAGFEFFEIQPVMRDRLSNLIDNLANPASRGKMVQNNGVVTSEATPSSSRDLWR